MSAILDMITTLLAGRSVSPLDLLGLLVVLYTYKITGKYLEELHFSIFPLRSWKTRVVQLQTALIEETKRAADCRDIAERAIARANELNWLLVTERQQSAAAASRDADNTRAA